MDAIRPIEEEAALRACFPVMHQLRPHLADADELVARWRRQMEEGYRLIAVWRDSVPVALAGYRLQENLVYGRFLYVDDLVTDANLRSSGLGNVLMDHLKAETQRQGCVRLVLDTPMSNVLGHRFYYRSGLLAGALRFGINVPPGGMA